MELYTVDETARLLRVSPITIRRRAAGRSKLCALGAVCAYTEATDRF